MRGIMTHAMNIRSQFGLLRLLAAALMVILGGYQAAATMNFYWQLRAGTNEPSAGFTIGSPWPSVASADARAAAAGLVTGERILQIQGQQFQGKSTLDEVMEKLFAGDRIRVTVQSADGVPREVSWQT